MGNSALEVYTVSLQPRQRHENLVSSYAGARTHFVHVLTAEENIFSVNYDLLTGVVGSRGTGIIAATMITWRN